jgi:hypothetical protein
MAKQSSFIKLEGTIGDVTFYKGQNGYNARQKGGVSRSRILNDDAFQRTRENLAEFARAANAGKLLKDAFRELTLKARDLRTHNRLYSQSLKVLKTDMLSDRGERKVENGDISLFEGFQFSNNSVLESTVLARFEVTNDDTEVSVTFAPFDPKKYLSYPIGATDFRFFMVGTAVEFHSGNFLNNITSTDPIKIVAGDLLEPLILALPKITEIGAHRLFALGIEYLQDVNGKTYPLNNGAHNAAKIIITESNE